MDAIIIMLLLQLKHWFVDFWIQSYQQTVCKGIYGNPVGLSHTIEHVIGTLAALLIANIFVPISPFMILLIGLLDLIIHYHVDYVKVHYGIKNSATTRFWREFGLDQLAHQLTYLGFAYLVISR
jgi:hypothetical protein